MIVTCALPPGLFLSVQELQAQTGVGRTPVHQVVSRPASDTLIRVRPRHGIQIAPIDLSRERTLLRLRRDMERFVVQNELRAHPDERRATEAAVAVHALNRMPGLGRPSCVRIT